MPGIAVSQKSCQYKLNKVRRLVRRDEEYSEALGSFSNFPFCGQKEGGGESERQQGRRAGKALPWAPVRESRGKKTQLQKIKGLRGVKEELL